MFFFCFGSGLFLRTVTRVKVMMVYLKETLKILILTRKSESAVRPAPIYSTRILTIPSRSDDSLPGSAQQFDFGSGDEAVPPLPLTKPQKSKQIERPKKIIPTASSSNDSSSSSSSDDDDAPVTMANMAQRSRKLEVLAAEEAALAQEELKASAAFVDGEEEDEDADMSGIEDVNGDVTVEPFRLPTAEEREEEKTKGGPDLQTVQRRMRECVRILSKFKKRAEQGR
jgi:ribosomal RNA methyltransferase Nop2